MFSMKQVFYGPVLPIVGLLFHLTLAPANAAETTDVFELLQKALASGDEMVQSAQEDQLDPFRAQATDFSDRIKEAVNLVSPATDAGDQVRGHLQMALSEAGKAISSANDGQMDAAIDHALNALSHAEEANSLADTLR